MSANLPHRVVRPGSFEPESHFYPRVLNAQLHPLVHDFLALDNARIINRYCHLRPAVSAAALQDVMGNAPRYFRWGGADLFVTTTDRGVRQVVVIETNSCPSGQKSMPSRDDLEDQAGYRQLLERTFVPQLKRRSLPPGGLAVVYDKNPMETTGYAAALADLTDQPVYLVPWHHDDPDPPARFDDGVLYVRPTPGAPFEPIAAAFRYVTQRPWTRIPPITRTFILNPVVVDLAGGRNKMLAAKAYDIYNAQIEPAGLRIRAPETIWDVAHDEVPLWVRRMGGIAVVKNPYSNAGQGVWTLTTPRELEAFMDTEQRYGRFIVQALIGNSGWSSRGRDGRLYHVGTVPDRKGRIYCADLRFMVGAGPDGFFPLAIYARRAREPLAETIGPDTDSWAMLGTNLSVKREDGGWDTETTRLRLMDNRDFNRLGLGVDDLIECYVQTILAIGAIDQMAQNLVTQRQRFRRRLFRSLNPDDALVDEICHLDGSRGSSATPPPDGDLD
ncbi:MAG: hypothetical protein EP329_09555 [Deltaproteobacteria bacterium]|nr:MAG: hypothetical protein EP329_09555 [Deltaproteobacteria bacterium]